MKLVQISLILFLLLSFGCKQGREQNLSEEKSSNKDFKIEVQGHRGARGNMPENSIPAFISAIKDGVDVLEMDVVISKDGQVVVSHEPFMSSAYVLKPDGDSIHVAEEKFFNLYTMPYDSIKKFDIGSKGNKSFPAQQKLKTYKPLLAEVIDTVERYIEANKLKPVGYNIELKSDPREYGKSQPKPEVFAAMVMTVIEKHKTEGAFSIQSFDPAVLNVMHQNFPETALAYLVYKEGIPSNLSTLYFTPEIYSPNYGLVKGKAFVDSVKAMGMKLIPWTVNDSAAIAKMINFRVDGIISDYPVRVIHQLN